MVVIVAGEFVDFRVRACYAMVGEQMLNGHKILEQQDRSAGKKVRKRKGDVSLRRRKVMIYISLKLWVAYNLSSPTIYCWHFIKAVPCQVVVLWPFPVYPSL